MIELNETEINNITFSYAEEVYFNATKFVQIEESITEYRIDNQNINLIMKTSDGSGIEKKNRLIYQSVENIVSYRLNRAYNEELSKKLIQLFDKVNLLSNKLSLYLSQENLKSDKAANELPELQKRLKNLIPLVFPKEDINEEEINLYNLIAHPEKFTKNGAFSSEEIDAFIFKLDASLSNVSTFVDDNSK